MQLMDFTPSHQDFYGIFDPCGTFADSHLFEVQMKCCASLQLWTEGKLGILWDTTWCYSDEPSE